MAIAQITDVFFGQQIVSDGGDISFIDITATNQNALFPSLKTLVYSSSEEFFGDLKNPLSTLHF